jgi:hypothetical protein
MALVQPSKSFAWLAARYGIPPETAEVRRHGGGWALSTIGSDEHARFWSDYETGIDPVDEDPDAVFWMALGAIVSLEVTR